MDDFSIRPKYLPKAEQFNSDEAVLRSILRGHFMKVIKYELQNYPEPTGEYYGESRDPTQGMKYVEESPNSEIAEISFGNSNYGSFNAMRELAGLEEDYEKNRIKADRYGEDDSTHNELQDLKETFNEKLMAYKKDRLRAEGQGDGMEEMDESQFEVKYAYISFKTMRGRDLVEQAYARNNSYYRNYCCKCF